LKNKETVSSLRHGVFARIKTRRNQQNGVGKTLLVSIFFSVDPVRRRGLAPPCGCIGIRDCRTLAAPSRLAAPALAAAARFCFQRGSLAVPTLADAPAWVGAAG